MFTTISALLNSIRYYDTIVHLAKLSDDELKHLNLSRGDIAHVALKQYWKSNGIPSQSFR